METKLERTEGQKSRHRSGEKKCFVYFHAVEKVLERDDIFVRLNDPHSIYGFYIDPVYKGCPRLAYAFVRNVDTYSLSYHFVKEKSRKLKSDYIHNYFD